MDELPSLWATLAVRSLANASAKLAGLLLDVIHVHVRFLEAKMDEDGNDDWKFRPAFDVLRSLAGAQSRSVWSIDDYADRRHSRPAALAAIGTLGMGLVFHGRSAELVPTFADPTYLCLQLGGDLVCSPSLVEWVNGRPAHKLLGLGPSTVESEKPVAWKDNELAYLPNGLLLVSVWLSSRFEEVAPRVCKATRLSAVLECLTWPGLSCGDENAQCPIILTFVASAPLSLVMGACSSDRTPDGRHWAAHVPQLASVARRLSHWTCVVVHICQKRPVARPTWDGSRRPIHWWYGPTASIPRWTMQHGQTYWSGVASRAITKDPRATVGWSHLH